MEDIDGFLQRRAEAAKQLQNEVNRVTARTWEEFYAGLSPKDITQLLMTKNKAGANVVAMPSIEHDALKAIFRRKDPPMQGVVIRGVNPETLEVDGPTRDNWRSQNRETP